METIEEINNEFRPTCKFSRDDYLIGTLSTLELLAKEFYVVLLKFFLFLNNPK